MNIFLFGFEYMDEVSKVVHVKREDWEKKRTTDIGYLFTMLQDDYNINIKQIKNQPTNQTNKQTNKQKYPSDLRFCWVL